MNKSLHTYLLTTTIILLSLYLAACGKDEKATPTAEKSVTEQTTQPAVKPETSAPVTPPPVATTEVAPEPAPKTTPVTHPAENQQTTSGQDELLALARKSGCLSCHMVDKKIVGPAWKDVAARYKDNTNARALLIEKVSKGGSGNWTDVVGNAAMPPYFPRVSKENIEKLVDFILSL